MKLIELRLPLPPSANDYWNVFSHFNSRTRKWYCKPATTQVALDYKKTVEEICQRNLINPMLGEVVMFIVFHYDYAKRDLDNGDKVLWDSLSGIAFMDDVQVVARYSRKVLTPIVKGVREEGYVEIKISRKDVERTWLTEMTDWISKEYDS